MIHIIGISAVALIFGLFLRQHNKTVSLILIIFACIAVFLESVSYLTDIIDTLSGMVMLLLGRVPSESDVVEWEDWRFEVVDMDGKTLDKVLATKLEPLVSADAITLP